VRGGGFVAIQDADLEYDPEDLKRLLLPLVQDRADVVLGSRFLSNGAHRVLYFWHSMGNQLLTFLSNMFTDLNLTDMETCYKVFKREVIQSVTIEECRFGFEPEIVAKVAHKNLRIYEIGISYYGRTYQEGKKIGAKDGIRALYCIFKYNAGRTRLPVQLAAFLCICSIGAVVNVLVYLAMGGVGLQHAAAVVMAFGIAALIQYFFAILFVFRHRSKKAQITEMLLCLGAIGLIGWSDLFAATTLLQQGLSPVLSKAAASAGVFLLNFFVRDYLVLPARDFPGTAAASVQ
jgi:putative flippase GtrA